MRRVVGLAGVAGALLVAAPAALAAGPPPIQRPNPALAATRVDYVNPIVDADGHVHTLAPLLQTVMAEAVSDQRYLSYQQRDDLGGFVPAPVGGSAASTGGRPIVGIRTKTAEIPRYAAAVDGTIRSFAFVGGPPEAGGTPDNGQQPVPGLGVPPTAPPPSNTNTVPPPNQGFGGAPSPPGTTTTTAPAPATTEPTTPTSPAAPTTTTTTTRPAPTTTTATTTTTTSPAATTTAATSAAEPPPPEPPAATTATGASCGTTGLSITSDHDTCRINATNMAPGGAASEVMTIRNDSDSTFTLSVRAVGTPNRLWDELTLGIWAVGTAAPTPLPPLLWWTAQDNAIGTLRPGQTVSYNVVLYLPTSAGNDTQHTTAVIDLQWSARGI
jgi:hypothetical protein